jgi:hypothetical protein
LDEWSINWNSERNLSAGIATVWKIAGKALGMRRLLQAIRPFIGEFDMKAKSLCSN